MTLRPVVVPYTRAHLDLTDPKIVWVLRIAQLLVGALAFVLLLIVADIMAAVALLAAVGPARRGLRVQPSEALE
jgi:hypothetical protein